MELITVKEAAERLAITERALREWLKRGDIQGIKMGRIWRLEKSVVEDFINDNRR